MTTQDRDGRIYFSLDDGRVISVELAPLRLRPSWTREEYANLVQVHEVVGEHFDEIACVRIPSPAHAKPPGGKPA